MSTSAQGLTELGRRLRARREEARLDLPALASRSGIPAEKIDAFEGGHGGLALAALMRLASALGVPATSFVHTHAPIVPAPIEPSVVLKGLGAAWLHDADREALAAALRRARAFTEIGEVLNVPRLADEFRPSAAPERNAHLPGYDAANTIRGKLLRSGPLKSVARLLEDSFNVLVLRHRFVDPRVLGAACRSGSARVVAVNVGITVETTRRFALAHELGHHVLDLDDAGVTADERPEHGARAWFDKAPREKRADAFAAMLLAPAAAVAAIAGQPRSIGAYDEAKAMVNRVREQVGMGFAATTWHLHNLRYLDERVAETLLLAEPEADPVSGFEEDTRFDGLERRVLEACAREVISRGRARELLGGVDPDALASAP